MNAIEVRGLLEEQTNPQWTILLYDDKIIKRIL